MTRGATRPHVHACTVCYEDAICGMRCDTDADAEDGCCAGASWDPQTTGTTCGGLELRGAWVCHTCGRTWIGQRSVPVERWQLSRGGRSVDTGVCRIRVEGGDPGALVARIVRLPDLERALAGACRALEKLGDPLAAELREVLGQEER